jgi:hypothetical protein
MGVRVIMFRLEVKGMLVRLCEANASGSTRVVWMFSLMDVGGSKDMAVCVVAMVWPVDYTANLFMFRSIALPLSVPMRFRGLKKSTQTTVQSLLLSHVVAYGR